MFHEYYKIVNLYGFVIKYFCNKNQIDSTVLERSLTSKESWLLCAKAFAESDPRRSLLAFMQAYLISFTIINEILYGWELVSLLQEDDF